MKAFNWERFKLGGNTVHCTTERESDTFLKMASNHGINFGCGTPLGNRNIFKEYMSKTCYDILEGENISVCSLDAYKNLNYTILEWSDYMEFVKEDLKVGMLVCTKRDMAIVMPYADGNVLVYKHGGHSILDSFNFSNIIAVWGLATMPNITMWFSGSWRPLLYERKETKEMTVEEISKALGYDVKIVK